MNVRGRVCRVEDASGVELRNYGGLGEIVKSDRIMQGAAWDQIDHTFTTKYVFDSFGRMLSMVYPDGETLTYGYDKGGRVNKVTGTKSNQTTTYVKDILYDEFGQRTELDYGNDVKTTQSYEPDTRRLDIQIIKSPTNTLRTLDYGYDLADNILTITDKRTNVTPFFQQADRTYTYDDLHRLKTFTLTAVPASTAPSTTVNANYDYDNVGGLLIQNVNRKEGNSVLTAYPSRDWTYTYGDPELPNLPNTIGPYTFSYDKRGAVLSFTRQSNSKAPIGATYTWDDEGRLKTSEPQGNGAVTAYTYNQDGQRARKQTPATLKNKNDPVDATVYPNEFYTARFARTSNKNCASPPCWEKVISRSKNIYVDKERIAVMASVIDPASAYNSETNLNRLTEITRYFNSDQVGSTALTTDEQGKPVQQIDYLPFGEVLFDQQASGNESLPEAYLFDGKELDSETGLQYFGARYYDPRFGRFISADPLLSWSPERGLVNPPLLNLYAYASNNPVKNREPDGQKPCTECTFEEEEVTVITNQPGKYRLNPNGPYTAPRNQSLNLSIKSDVNRSVLNESVLDRIQNAMDRAEIEAATITSSKRTPREQAEAMLNNLLTLGAKHESGLYRRQPIALEAISTAEQLKAQGWDPDMLKTAMKLTIEKDPNQFEHLRNMNNLVTIDIGPNSLLSNQLNEQCQCTMAPWSLAQRLARSLAQEPGVVSQYVLSPPVDRSIHFTITK